MLSCKSKREIFKCIVHAYLGLNWIVLNWFDLDFSLIIFTCFSVSVSVCLLSFCHCFSHSVSHFLFVFNFTFTFVLLYIRMYFPSQIRTKLTCLYHCPTTISADIFFTTFSLTRTNYPLISMFISTLHFII